MHRQLIQASVGQIVDHKNHDTLDCRKINLRITDKSGNSANRKKQRGGHYTSQYKGVHKHTQSGLWVAKIEHRGQLTFTKYFKSEAEAAQAYNDNAPRFFGEFAYLNEIAA